MVLQNVRNSAPWPVKKARAHITHNNQDESYASKLVSFDPAARLHSHRPLIVVDLGALEFVGIVDVDCFPFGEKIDGGNGGFAVAVAGLLGTAKGQVRLGADGRGIDVDNSRVEVARGLE